MPGNPAIIEAEGKGDKDVAQPSMPNGKASAIPPQISTGEEVELADILDDETKHPLLEDVMQLARLGEVGPIQKLFEQGKVGPNFHDEEGITPLHVCRSEMSFLFIGPMYTNRGSSGRPSTTSTLYASS